MGQVESLEAAPGESSAGCAPPRARVDPRAVQLFHGLRPELLQQLEDIRALLRHLHGAGAGAGGVEGDAGLGLDPVMDPECTVHDAVSSLLSQYVDKVGSLSLTVRDAGSTVPVSFSPSPSFSGSPVHPLSSPTSASSATATSASIFSTSAVSSTPSADASASTSGTGGQSSPCGGGGVSLAFPGTPVREGPRSRPVKRPMKRFSAGKWVSAVVRAMGMTSNKSELERLEAGLEALARAEHDWLAAKLSAVAGRALRLPPSRVEEVTAVGLAVWVEFWHTWAGKPLAKSTSTAGSGSLPPRPTSSAGARKLQGTPSNSFKWRSGRDVAALGTAARLDASSYQGSWKDRKPPPLALGEPPTPSRQQPLAAGDMALLGHDRLERQEGAATRPFEGAAGRGYERLAMRPEMHEEAEFFNVDLGASGGRRDLPGASPKDFDDMVPISLDGDEPQDGREARPKGGAKRGPAVPEPREDAQEDALGGHLGRSASMSSTGSRGGEGAKGALAAGEEEEAELRRSSTGGGASRFLGMEVVLRADIGARLQRTLLEECLQDPVEGRPGQEAAPPPHAEIVRLLGLAASAASLRQVSAAACVLRLLDGLGREWRGSDESVGTASPQAAKDWDRLQESRECRGFVLQCLVDLLEACQLRCAMRHHSGMPNLEGSTPTGRVRRLRSLGEEEDPPTPALSATRSFDRSGLGLPWGDPQHLGALASPHPSVSRGSEDGGDEDEAEGEGPTAPCPASLVELAESSLVWKTLHRKDLSEAQKFRELDRVFEKPVGPGVLALALADEAQRLRHLSTQDLWVLSDQVEDLGCFEAAFRFRLRAIAGEYEDMDAVVEVVRGAYSTRGIESVPLRLKRLCSTAKFALTHAPSASARHDYAMTFGACMLEPLLEDSAYPWAFEIADNYVGLSGLFGPLEKGEEEAVQLRTRLLCARIIMRTVVEPLLVEEEDPLEEAAWAQGAQDEEDLSACIARALAEGRDTSELTRLLTSKLRAQGEQEERHQRDRRRRRKERALRAWAEGVDYPGIEVGWLQWQAMGMLLQSHNPQHPALVPMWAKAVRGNFKSINDEGSSADKEAVELLDWGLEGLLLTFAGEEPHPAQGSSLSPTLGGKLGVPLTPGCDGLESPLRNSHAEQNGHSSPASGEDVARTMELRAAPGGSMSASERDEWEDAQSVISLRDHCLLPGGGAGASFAGEAQRHPGILEMSSGRGHPDLCPVTPTKLPFACEWILRILAEVRPREKERADLLLALGSRMAGAIYWKWPKRKENQKYIARLLLYAHRVVGLSAQQKQRAMKVGERIWGWMLPNASLVRDQCETDEEAQEIMENAIYATWLGAAC